MARIKKKDVPPHIVIPDTSVLWHGDKTHVVAPTFDTFWSKNRKEFNLELVVPNVVKGEILFQQTTSANRVTDRIDELISKVSAISAHRYVHKIKPNDLKIQVEARFDKWVRACHGKITPVPVNRMNWPRLINDAIWRVPPFSEDRNDKDFEKGFRDSLILETIVEYCKHRSKKDISIALVCGDELLRDAADARLSDDPRFSSYETLEEFESYLSLTRQELTDQFIRRILKRAFSKFFSREDDSCLVIKADVPGEIVKEYKQYFNDPRAAQKYSLGPLTDISLGSKENWNAVDSGMFWVSYTVFDRIENANIYHWKNTFTYAQLYQRTELTLGGMVLPSRTTFTQRRVLVLPVSVAWHARVTTDARFHDIELDEMTMGEKDFRRPTAEDIKAFNLPEEASLDAFDSDDG